MRFKGEETGVEFGPWLRVTSPQRWRESDGRKTDWQGADSGDRWRRSDGQQWRVDKRAQNQDEVMAGDMGNGNQGDALRGFNDCNIKKQEGGTFHSFFEMQGESLTNKKGIKEK
jgi:hypothetical protein